MSSILAVNGPGEVRYDIVFDDSYEELAGRLCSLGFEGRKMAIITDSNVGPLYADAVKDLINPIASKVIILVIPAGEEHKKLEEIENLYEGLIAGHFDRHDLILALGGGVTGDMAGFTAATYLRGIAFVQLPTTLLAQADSSIGGKTGVDLGGYKNMVGAFYMPRLVYMNMSVLKTLPGKEYSSGFAEIMKHGLIKDEEFYLWLLEHMDEIRDRDAATLSRMLMKSCMIKCDVVERDPTEKGERALLNFGHTLGHAIEKYRDFSLLHGECVALGCVCAAYISSKRGLISSDEFYEIRDMFVPFGLPITVEDIDADEVVRLTHSDKKADGRGLKFILLEKLGKAFIATDVSDEEMRQALDEIIWTMDNE